MLLLTKQDQVGIKQMLCDRIMHYLNLVEVPSDVEEGACDKSGGDGGGNMVSGEGEDGDADDILFSTLIQILNVTYI